MGKLILLLILLQLPSLEGGKVLIVPFYHRSHANIFGNLGKALSENGHDVWVLMGNKFVKHFEDKKVFLLTFDVPKEADMVVRLEKEMQRDPSGKSTFDECLVNPWTEPGRYCDEALTNEHIVNEIRTIKFDIAIMDGGMGQECMFTIPYKYGIPYITVHGMQTASWGAGVTGMPSIEPDVMTKFSNRMNFWERLGNLHAWKVAMNNPFMEMYDKHFLQIHVPEKPPKTFYEIIRDSEMFLLNYNVLCLDYPRVSAPNYQYLGPSTITPAKPLSKDLESFVQGAEHGVVIMSLGSFRGWQYLWRRAQEKVFRAFGRLKQRVVVHYNLDEDVGQLPENIFLMKWLPQIDLLAHPKTKLFITHGGNNGQNEAVYHGVPMLVIPIMGDQVYAGVRAEAKGYGKYVEDIDATTSDDLYKMIQEVINNSSFSANVQRCSRIIQSLPSAQETFVYWVNHILEFGGHHLRPPSLEMPLYQVLMVDIVIFYIGVLVVVFHVTIALIYMLFRKYKATRKIKRE